MRAMNLPVHDPVVSPSSSVMSSVLLMVLMAFELSLVSGSPSLEEEEHPATIRTARMTTKAAIVVWLNEATTDNRLEMAAAKMPAITRPESPGGSCSMEFIRYAWGLSREIASERLGCTL